MGETMQAVKEFEEVYAIQPANDSERRRLMLLLAECYLRQGEDERVIALLDPLADIDPNDLALAYLLGTALLHQGQDERGALMIQRILRNGDRKSTRLNSSHLVISYAVFCLKKKHTTTTYGPSLP